MTHFIPSLFTTLLLFLLSPTTIAATTTTTTVYDTNGHPLKPNTNYYILPVLRGKGGGLTLSPKNTTQQCPLFVSQYPFELSKGLPIKLFPLNPKDNHISLSVDLNFEFDSSSICVQSTVWRLSIDEVTGRRYVGIGGVVGNPGVNTISNWFRIEKSGSGKYDYKIVFCPSVCNFCKVMCGDLGVFVEGDGKRFLGFNDQPLLVTFQKA